MRPESSKDGFLGGIHLSESLAQQRFVLFGKSTLHRLDFRAGRTHVTECRHNHAYPEKERQWRNEPREQPPSRHAGIGEILISVIRKNPVDQLIGRSPLSGHLLDAVTK